MTALRRILGDHRPLALWLAMAALLLKLLVPAGFMPVVSGDGLRLEICSGMGAETRAMAHMPGMADHGDPARPGKPDQPCGFGGLSAPPLAFAPVLLLATALPAIALRSRPPAVVIPPAPRALRPPPRGPPAPL